MPNIKHKEEGFTLIELLVVIAIIGILAAVIFVALDPATRFADARNAVRQNDVQEILSAVKLYQVDNGGDTMIEVIGTDTEGDGLATGTTYQIGQHLNGAGECANDVDGNVSCGAGDCIDLYSTLSGGYLGDNPVSPNGAGSWSTDLTGYTYEEATNTGVVTITACDVENNVDQSRLFDKRS